VDYLKDNTIEANPNTKILMMYTMSCVVNLVTEVKRGFKRSRRREKEEKEVSRVERERNRR
jgi:hypothetical protein